MYRRMRNLRSKFGRAFVVRQARATYAVLSDSIVLYFDRSQNGGDSHKTNTFRKRGRRYILPD
jgi:hypothetical protein